MDIWPLISGAAGAASPHEAYYLYWNQNLQAVRMGDWKLHFPHPYRTLAGRKGGSGGTPAPYEQASIDLSLFNLRSDIGESKNVASEHPEVVARIKTLADRARADLGDEATGQKGTGLREPGRLEAGDPRFHSVPGQPMELKGP